MNLWHCISIALVNLRANKLRSILTMLGIIIGVSAVIDDGRYPAGNVEARDRRLPEAGR